MTDETLRHVARPVLRRSSNWCISGLSAWKTSRTSRSLRRNSGSDALQFVCTGIMGIHDEGRWTHLPNTPSMTWTLFRGNGWSNIRIAGDLPFPPAASLVSTRLALSLSFWCHHFKRRISAPRRWHRQRTRFPCPPRRIPCSDQYVVPPQKCLSSVGLVLGVTLSVAINRDVVSRINDRDLDLLTWLRRLCEPAILVPAVRRK